MTQTITNKLGTEKISKLIFQLSVPAVLAQIINVLYNIVDRIYIGHMKGVGDIALTGVGVSFSIIMIISAFAAFVGMGGAPLASIQLGSGNKEEAERILGNSVTVLVLISVILTAFFMIWKEPLLFAFGASEKTITYANDYLTIYLMGTLFVQIALGLNTFISAQGFATTAMLSVLIGAVINIILDPILMFGLNMGVSGAALATIISQFVSAAWVFGFLISKKSTIRIIKKHLIPNKKIVIKVLSLGVAPFIMQSTESLVTIILNSGLQHYGNDYYVGAMTIIMSILQLIIMPVNGIAQGTQPIMSYNFGAGNIDRVKKAFQILIFVTLSITTIECIIVRTFPTFFVHLFNKKQELVDIATRTIPIYFAGIWAIGAQLACQSAILALGQAKLSLFLAILRKIVLLIPLALILPVLFGVEGIFYSEPVADIIACTTTVILFMLNFNKMLNKKDI